LRSGVFFTVLLKQERHTLAPVRERVRVRGQVKGRELKGYLQNIFLIIYLAMD
jgi:hypothetical protein